MKRWIMASVLLVAVGLFATVSWSDVTSGSATTPPVPSLPAQAPEASGSAALDVDLGVIPYSAMSSAEQAQIDRGASSTGWDQTNAAFAAAGQELSQRAAANAAAQQLGVDPDQGVIQ